MRASGSAWTTRTLTLPDGRRPLAPPLPRLMERLVVRLHRGGNPPSLGATAVLRRLRLRGSKLQGAECRGCGASAPLGRWIYVGLGLLQDSIVVVSMRRGVNECGCIRKCARLQHACASNEIDEIPDNLRKF